MKKENRLPELLLPAGNVENFRAAVEGGADAVYLGLRKFNARGRATNLTNERFISVLEEAKQKQVQVYVTLNTIIKNDELPQLLDMLWFLSKTSVDAVIIQDWGVYYLMKRYFPKLVIHASTQMGNHNSSGANFALKKGIERVVLARELTKDELSEIARKTSIEIEYFVHGALCYSFSGMCLFSSYIGGQGANRGMCAQPCRRAYSDSSNSYLFSLKDNQLIDELSSLKEMGIASIKIEGRMKSAEYVYTTAQSYRKALDDIRQTQHSKKLLKLDMGRDKTAYFFGGNVKNAITSHPNTGIFIGKVIKVSQGVLLFESNKELDANSRIRFVSAKTEEQVNFKMNDFKHIGGRQYQVKLDNKAIRKNDKVFLIGGVSLFKFSNKIQPPSHKVPSEMPKNQKQKIIQGLRQKPKKSKSTLFVRIDNPDWLRKIWLDKIGHLILNLKYSDLSKWTAKNAFIKKNISKIWIELPKFIPEKKQSAYQEQLKRLYKEGVKQFFISHISQKELLPSGARFACNENVYVFNDAAAAFLTDEKATFYSYPLENDFGNLYAMKNRSGIVPLYFFPDLFYSRMPVKVNDKENVFQDDAGRKYKKTVVDGITIVRPEVVVSTLKHRPKMEKLGYHRFLVDFSNQKPSKHVFNKVIKAYMKSEAMNNTTSFNLRRELK